MCVCVFLGGRRERVALSARFYLLMLFHTKFFTVQQNSSVFFDGGIS